MPVSAYLVWRKGGLSGFRTRLQLYTVPGQVYYESTRRLVLRGADGIVQSPAAPPHTGDGHTWHHGDDQLRDVVMLGQGEMPAFGDVLTEEQVMSVIEYIKGWWSDEQRRYQADVTATQTR